MTGKRTNIGVVKWTPAVLGKALTLYMEGKTIEEISKACRVAKKTVANSLSRDIKRIVEAQNARHKSNGNMWNNQSADIRLHNPALKDPQFQQMLSDPEAESLTQFEEDFCWHYNITNDQVHSAIQSDLDVGLYETNAEGKKVRSEQYTASVKLRAIAMLMKPNIKAKLDELQKTALFDVDKVNKGYLQRMILQQVNNLDGASPEDRRLGRDYIQMLGRTFGGFTEKIEIGMVDHRKSVRKLAALAQADDLATLRAKKEAEKQQDGVDGSGQAEV